MSQYKTIGSAPYEGERKALCRLVKDGDIEAIKEAAAILERYVTSYTVLIPVPGHNGYADYTAELARQIKEKADTKYIEVFDCLVCDEHESLCEVKRAGGDADDVPLNIRFRGLEEEDEFNEYYFCGGYKILLVDNIVDTGNTARACMDVLGDCDVLCLCDTGRDEEREILTPREGIPVYIHIQNSEDDLKDFESVYAVEQLPGIPAVGEKLFASYYAKKTIVENILGARDFVWEWSRLIKNPGSPDAHLTLDDCCIVCDRWWNGYDNSVHLVLNDKPGKECKAVTKHITKDEYRTLLRNFRLGWL